MSLTSFLVELLPCVLEAEAESGENLLGRCCPFRQQSLRVCPMGIVAVE